MRAGLVLILSLCWFPLLAQEGSDAWTEVRARAEWEKKPIVVFFTAPACERCRDFERVSAAHPAIERRLPAVVFAVLPGAEPGVAFFDRAGQLRARWPIVPDTTNFGIILDSVIAVAPHFERAVELSEAGATHEAQLAAAIGLARLGRLTDARAAIAGVRANGSAAMREAAIAIEAVLDERERKAQQPPPAPAPKGLPQPIRIGPDGRIVHEPEETFRLRLLAPREGAAGGAVRVSMSVRAPAARRVRRVVVSWNDTERAVLTAAPWEKVIDIPAGQVGVLRAVAELDDGRTSEDAVLLNAGGMVGQVDVHLVELPVTVMSRSGAVPQLTPDRIHVREGNTRRRVDSVSSAAETPLTVGLLIDVSASMQKTLPDLQEAAIRFLETSLGERDRAFVVTFDSSARLLQPATSDVALLRRRIMGIRPDGLTALHDAMVLGLLQFQGIKGRRALIVFSDGIDMTSRYGAADAGELAKRLNVPVHVIAALPGMTGLGLERPAEGELTRIAQSTGGTYQTLHDLSELRALYARIEAALRAQLLLFVRTDPATHENEWRSVQVEIEGLDVFAPEGYYAAW